MGIVTLQPDVTPFAPNCSEGAPVNARADPIALSLERLVRECPDWPYGQRIDEHENGARVHVRRLGEDLLCLPRELVGTIRVTGLRHSDAQRDYWSRRGRG